MKDEVLPSVPPQSDVVRVIGGEPKLSAHIQIRLATEDERQEIEQHRELRRMQDEETFWNIRNKGRP
jgi:hypothetical protein